MGCSIICIPNNIIIDIFMLMFPLFKECVRVCLFVDFPYFAFALWSNKIPFHLNGEL